MVREVMLAAAFLCGLGGATCLHLREFSASAVFFAAALVFVAFMPQPRRE